jgi:hypothetical protein
MFYSIIFCLLIQGHRSKFCLNTFIHDKFDYVALSGTWLIVLWLGSHPQVLRLTVNKKLISKISKSVEICHFNRLTRPRFKLWINNLRKKLPEKQFWKFFYIAEKAKSTTFLTCFYFIHVLSRNNLTHYGCFVEFD